MATLYAGTSGFAYAAWKPGFYPAKLASKNFLNRRLILGVVEIAVDEAEVRIRIVLIAVNVINSAGVE